MLRVTTNNARPGMVLAQPVFHPQRPGHVLLKPNAVLDTVAIEKLAEYRIGVLWIRYPALDFVARYVSPHIAAEHSRLTATLAEGFDRASRDAQAVMEFSAYADAVRALLQQIIENPQSALFIQDMVNADRPLLAHCSNVCLLSLLMGLRLDGYLVNQRRHVTPGRAKRIESLGLGALLHDLGMLRVSPSAQDRWNKTHNLEDPEIRRHVLLGFEVLRGNIPPTAAAVALHHHQRWDGTGFPSIRKLDGTLSPLAGKQIHIFPRIVCVADTFDRLRNPPLNAPFSSPASGGVGAANATRPAVIALRAVLEQTAAGALDAVVVRALLGVAPAYAPGTMVTLTDGDEAVVTGWDPADPCRPTVRHLIRLDANVEDESALGPEIDLRHRKELAIKACDGCDVSAANFSPQDIARLLTARRIPPAAKSTRHTSNGAKAA